MWWLLGLITVLFAGGLVYVTAEHRFGRTLALAITAGAALALPLLLARLLLGAFRRIDADAGLFESAAGMSVVCALGALAILAFVWRAELAEALVDTPDRHPRVPHLAGRVARAAGRWITPTVTKAPPRPSKTKQPPSKTVAKRSAPPPPRPEGGAATHPPPPPRTDGGTPDAGTRDAAVIPTTPEPAGLTAETVRVCDEGSEVSAFWAEELGGAASTEIVVLCAKDYMPTDVRVLWLTEDGRLTERTRITVYPPQDLVLMLQHPRVVDLDEDGAKDLLLCALYMNQHQGPRGGDTWWARGSGDGQFLPPTRLVGSSCVGIDAGDIDGDQHRELVVVHMGNPWFEPHPQGEVRWYERTNRQFRLKGRKPILAWPSRLALSDVNGDGKLDAVIEHEDGNGTVVCPGTARGLDPMDAGLHPAMPPLERNVVVRLDADETDDRIEAIVGGSLQLWRSAPPGSAGATPARALDFREHVLGTPPTPGAAAAPDAGASD